MSRYSKIEKRMWGDQKFCALSPMQPSGQALFVYLLTGDFTGPIPGLFSAGRAAMAEALGWEVEQFQERFTEVFQQGMAKADWKARLVWIPNAIKYNRPESPNVAKYWAKELDNLPECDLKTEAVKTIRESIYQEGEAYGIAFDEVLASSSSSSSIQALGNSLPNGLSKASPKAMPKPWANPEPEPEQEPEPQQKDRVQQQSHSLSEAQGSLAADAAPSASPIGSADNVIPENDQDLKGKLSGKPSSETTGKTNGHDGHNGHNGHNGHAPAPANSIPGPEDFSLAPPEQSIGARRSSVPVREVVRLYNDICKDLPGVEVLNASREQAVRARWREMTQAGFIVDRDSGIDFFRKVFEYVQKNDFLCGRKAGRGGLPFTGCGFDWVMGPKNLPKVVEGNYG